MQSLIWTFPAIMFCSILIGWAAELAALHMSAGIALAILAFLQTLPEFGVEAYISWSGDTHLMLANLTGSLRLFVGLGWPVVFFIHFFSARGAKPRYVQMPKTFAVEATFLALPVLYFLVLAVRGSFHLYDGIVLCCMYLAYLALLNYQRLYFNERNDDRDEEEEDLAAVPRKISEYSLTVQYVATAFMFFIGGGVLFLAVHPFVEGLQSLAVAMGMTPFVFIQWVAPFASEFPEKITAFNWARKARKVPMAIFNMVSSSVNQWTLLAGFVPVVYSLSLKRAAVIEFDAFQHTEILLTVAQSALGVLFLAELRFHWFEALCLFGLWLVQFLFPATREIMVSVYAALVLLAIFRIVFQKRMPKAWSEFGSLMRWVVRRWSRRVYRATS